MDCRRKVALLSNVTADLLAGKLRGRYDVYVPEGFDTWVRETLDPSSGLYTKKPDAVILILDGTEARSWKGRMSLERIGLWKEAAETLLERMADIPVFLPTIDIRENRIRALSETGGAARLESDWHSFLGSCCRNYPNAYQIDIADLVCDMGRNQFYSDKMWYMGSMPYSREGLNALAKEIGRALDAVFVPRRKIIVLDLDNTLWGGVAGEDGVEGIELSDHGTGQRYYDFQRQLLEMKDRGILLAINSKNNLEDVENVLQNHPAMLLKEDDFVSCKVNWDNKVANLKQMEGELNLTEGSFLFIDDNVLEREMVKGECPGVTVPGFPENTEELLSFAEKIWLDYCRPAKVLGEDRKKTEMYQNETRRRKELSESISLEDYIRKLEISVNIHRMRSDELERVVQLCGKTNQFNVTTKRYTQAEIRAIERKLRNTVYVVHASDKYGDNGLVGVVILIAGEDGIRIDTFLMSCRVMGRGLEDVILNEIASSCAGKGTLVGEYIPTAKNAPVKDLYDRLGFQLKSDDGGHKIYELNTDRYKKKQFDSYKEIHFEG